MTANALMELAACPFCGGQASCDTQYQNGPADFNVICLDEFCIGGAWPVAWSCPTQEEAIAKWNTRTQLRTAAAEGGEVKPFGWLATFQNGEKELIYSLPTDPDYEDIPSRVQPLYLHPPTDSGAGRDALWCKVASELLPPWQWNMVNDRVRVIENAQKEAAISGESK